MFDDLKADLGRSGTGFRAILRETITTPGLWAVIGYRFRRKIFTTRRPHWLRRLLNVPATLAQVFVEATTCIQLPSSAKIGPGLNIPHTGYVVISSSAVIGRHCTITQGVTIGHGAGGGKSLNDSPVIGDRVYIGPGSIIMGPITIGDDALIGAGAVVTQSIPARGVAVGNPARIIARTGSFELIAYPRMDQDAARLASLNELRRAASTPIDSTPVVTHGRIS